MIIANFVLLILLTQITIYCTDLLFVCMQAYFWVQVVLYVRLIAFFVKRAILPF